MHFRSCCFEVQQSRLSKGLYKNYRAPEGGVSHGRENGLFYFIFNWKTQKNGVKMKGGGSEKAQNCVI